jgi:PAS domain S-box-containing protein
MKPTSIRSRLKAIIMAVTASTLALACGAFLTHDAVTSRRVARGQLESLGQIVAAQCTAALAFNDPKTATEILTALREESQVLTARVETAKGTPFAFFRRPGSLETDPAVLEIRRPVTADGEGLGTVVITSDLSDLQNTLRWNVGIALGVLLGGLLAAYFLSSRLERLITGPILDLVSTVRQISERKDYSLRARSSTQDETGQLIDGFNEMLRQIQERDAALLKARDQLEQRVAERTAELSRSNRALAEEIVQRNQEIVERRRAENALRAAEFRTRQIVESVHAIVWRADARTQRFTFVSPEAEHILGYPVEAWTADSDFWPGHLHPADRDSTVSACGEASRAGRAHELEYRMISADGRVVWLRDLVSVVMDGDRPVELIGVMIDVTAQKEAEVALRESEERYRHLFQSSPDGILIEAEGEVLLLNPAAEQILRRIGDDAADGRTLLDRIAPKAPLAATRDIRRYDDSWIRPDGRSLDVEVTVTPFTHAGRRGSQVMVRDITQRKDMERLKNEFISTVSHELRTPLTSIRGALGLLAAGKTGPLPASAQAFIDIAHTDSQRLIRLINDLLDIQKIEAGRMDFQVAPLDLVSLVSRALETNRGYGDSHGVRFVHESSVGEAPVAGDADRLLQVLANLLSNAAKFSPRGSTVEVGVDRADDRFRIWVRDHGAGIPEEFHARIFQKFAQADGSDSRQKGGTGLGLSISRAIVERHGGTIRFDTGPHGTTFIFEIPERASVPAH